VTKQDKYEDLLREVSLHIEDEHDETSVLANVSALLHEAFGWWWVGFYCVREGADGAGEQLFLGPFQGPAACYRIARGRGVCGTAWAEGRTVRVPDVHAFPGHIACSSESRSEIVVPLTDADGRVRAVLDIDSRLADDFDEVDEQSLERLALLVSHHLYGRAAVAADSSR